jgi:kinesin family protein 20
MDAEIRDEMTNTHQAIMAKMQSDHMKAILELVRSATLTQDQAHIQHNENEIRADKKIDIVARMTPGPARRYRDDTPMSDITSSEGDTSRADDSFTSALDVVSPIPSTSFVQSKTQPRISDPFVVQPLIGQASRVGVPGLTLTRSSDQRDELELDDALNVEEEYSGDETELDQSVQYLGASIADQVSCRRLNLGTFS